jgi:hypothetical protein
MPELFEDTNFDIEFSSVATLVAMIDQRNYAIAQSIEQLEVDAINAELLSRVPSRQTEEWVEVG